MQVHLPSIWQIPSTNETTNTKMNFNTKMNTFTNFEYANDISIVTTDHHAVTDIENTIRSKLENCNIQVNESKNRNTK